jgi:hypothetical protein
MVLSSTIMSTPMQSTIRASQRLRLSKVKACLLLAGGNTMPGPHSFPRRRAFTKCGRPGHARGLTLFTGEWLQKQVANDQAWLAGQAGKKNGAGAPFFLIP